MTSGRPKPGPLRVARAQLRGAIQLARSAATDPQLRRALLAGLRSRSTTTAPSKPSEAKSEPSDHTPPPGLEAYAVTAHASQLVAAGVEQTVAFVADPARFGEWLTMHAGWRGEAPEGAHEGQTFTQQAKIMGIPADVKWTVAAVRDRKSVV